uniref:Uncharacterized protein n=1 Tax=Arundo donax TaxID=35708 RepID=A0A0A9AQY5_ARUDO
MISENMDVSNSVFMWVSCNSMDMREQDREYPFNAH